MCILYTIMSHKSELWQGIFKFDSKSCIEIIFQEANITGWILTKEQATQTVEMELKKMTNKLGLWSFNVIKVIK